MDAQTLVVLLVIGIFIGTLLFFALRKPKPPEKEPRAKEPPEAEPTDALEPRTRALEDRMEVEAPVEIHEGMSLAEIKRAKAARVKGAKEKGRRKTAVEATEEARKELEESEVEEVEEPAEVDQEPEVEDVFDEEEPPEEEAPEAPEAEAPEAPEAEAPEEGVAEESSVDEGWDLLDDDDEDFAFGVAPSEPDEPDEPDEPEEPEEPEEVEEPEEPEEVEEPAVEEPAVEEPVGLDQVSESMGTPLSKGLERTRTGFIQRLGKLFRRDELDDKLVDEIEEVLYTADIGTRAATDILQAIEEHLSGDEKKDPDTVWEFVKDYVEDLLRSREETLDVDVAKPFVILVIGVNGVGKTTTIGKMAAKYQRAGKKVLLVAGDTFRAAAVEQIEVWGERAGIPVHTGDEKEDPSSVVFAGVERGVEEGFDIVICDTAGRLHTKAPLLDELSKMKRVAAKVIEDAPHETILVLDANTGQNAIQQAKIFRQAVPITGIVLTKLDGTAKGGVILGICDELDAPIRYIGIGESVADLRQFDAGEFTEALFM